MALTVVTPGTPGPIGPGYSFQLHTSLVGPYPTTDLIQVTLQPAGGFTLLRTRWIASGSSAFPQTTLGWMTDGDPITRQAGKLDPAAAGAAITISMTWLHASGAVFDSGNDTRAWTWDPVGGLGSLIEFLRTLGGPADTALLNAVRKVKTMPGQEP